MRVVRSLLRAAYERVVAVGLLVVIELSLRRTTLPATCRRLGVRFDLDGAAPVRGVTPVLPRWALPRVRAARLVAAHWPAGDTCLRRCLLVGHRLQRLDPVLRIGIRRAGGTFGAHSWLEIAGRPLDLDAVDFASLERPVR
jgi:Transglutaminase-like superfamily